MFNPLRSCLTSEDPKVIRIRQYTFAALGFLVMFGLLLAVVFYFEVKPQAQKVAQDLPAKDIASGGSRIKPEELWRFQMEDDNKKLRKSLQDLQETIETSRKEQTAQEQRTSYELSLEKSLQELQGELKNKTAAPSPERLVSQPSSQSTSLNGLEGVAQSSNALIQKFSFGRSLEEPLMVKTVKNTLPAGAFVQSILLSGVDASASMNAAASPRPMLLRMLDHGTLPRAFKSDLKDCHITAAAHGDLSSERVYARLEKLTCTVRRTGEIIETQVAGYIAGPDGKDGIRGIVVSKDAAFLERSLIGGLFSGLSNIASPQNRQNMVNPYAAGNPKVDAPSVKDMFGSGMAQGATNALDRLSQYYINRAEQLQPVIQVAAGQMVDVVFIEGVAFGSQGVKDKIARVRQTNATSSTPPQPSYGRSFAPASSNSTADNTSSGPQTFPTGD